MTVRLASCSCGQLQAEVRGDPTHVSVCHCYACQRRTGSVFSAQASFLRESVAIRGNGTEFVRVGDEGGRFRFTFCPGCGSTVFYVEEGDEQHIAIPSGSLCGLTLSSPYDLGLRGAQAFVGLSSRQCCRALA